MKNSYIQGKIIQKNCKSKDNSSEILLDPLFGLQPLPSIDLCLFNISNDIWEGKIKPLNIFTIKSDNEYGMIIVFFPNDGIIFKNHKYFYVNLLKKFL